MKEINNSTRFVLATKTTDNIIKGKKYPLIDIDDSELYYYIIDESGKEACYWHSVLSECKPVLGTEYSIADAFEIMVIYTSIKDPYDRFRFISQCSGIKLVIKGKRYWFEYYGKQMTVADIYIPNSSFARLLHAACDSL